MTYIQEKLFEIADKEYAKFQAKLAPTVLQDTFIGVRLPELRKLAKDIEKCDEYETFLTTLPHKYYDENILHSVLLSRIKPFEKCLELVELFLPYIDNWAVCDTLRPKVFKNAKNKAILLDRARVWSKSNETYTIRYGVDTLMAYFLDEDFKKEYNDIPAAVTSDEYYVKMMVAWYYATALAKQWDDTIDYIKDNRLPVWTHNKTIQKARESYRITPEQKEYLNTLKRKEED